MPVLRRWRTFTSSGQWCLVHDIHQDDPEHEYDHRICEGHHRDATLTEEMRVRFRAILKAR